MKRSEGLAWAGRSRSKVPINLGKLLVLATCGAANFGRGRQDLPRPNFTGFAFADFAVDFFTVPRGAGFDLTDCFGNLFDGWFLSIDDIS
jgi:hypothetical protein